MADLFTRYVDGTTQYKASHMNAPLIELETEINTDKAAIDAIEVDINQTGIATGAGKFVMVNEGGTAFVFKDIVCSGGEVVVCSGNVVFN